MTAVNGVELTGQPKDRSGQTLVDDFGRPWSVELDRRTMASVGLPIPAFKAPFPIPYQHLKEKAGQLGRIFIDFEGWIAELRRAWSEMEAQIQVLARDLFPNEIANVISAPHDYPALMRALGPAPLSERFVKALRAGHPWATGEIEADPRTLTNPKGERLFSEEEVAGLERYVNKHRSASATLDDDAWEFQTDVAHALSVPVEDQEEFGAHTAPQRTRGRRSRTTG